MENRMKCKKRKTDVKKYAISSIALLLAAALGAGGAFAGGSSASAEEGEERKEYIAKTGYPNLTDEEKAKRGNYESPEERIEDMQLVAEDGTLSLYLDPDFAEFAVFDKASQESWFSNPYDYESDTKAGGDTKNLLQSLISLTYYDAKATEGTMNSFTDCIAKDQYTIAKLSKGFALHMQIGRLQETMLVPGTIEASKFEEIILPGVSDRDARRLNTYYTKVSMSDNTLSESVKEGYLKNSPGLADHDFYILRGVVDREKRIIEEIIKETDYTMEDMEEDLALSGYEDEETVAALFNMSLYVELENGDLKVTVPADSISYDSQKFYLSSFQLLSYFGAGKYDQDGYLFVPDGSGALINYNKYGLKKILYTIKPVYGMDYSLSFNYELNSLSTQVYFPVFGNREGDGKAMFAIIEDGEALANIISESGNIRSSYETVYPQFSYETAYTVNYTDSSKIKGLYTYHDTNAYTGDYVMRYRFLTGEEADYVGMAKSYQAYLADKGILSKLPEQESTPGFYLEALGAIEKTSTIMGIPYTESVALTSFQQAQDILAQIQGVADVDLKLRYKGWENGGLYYSVSNGVDVEKSLGGKKGLAALESFTQQNGIGLYPDVDFFMVCNDEAFDGYSESTNGVRSIRRETLYLVEPQGMTNLAWMQYANYSVSPYYYEKYMSSYFKEYNKLQLSGISTGNIGTMLYAEYHKKKAVNREQAKDILTESLQSYTEGKGLMLDGGNAYVLPYASDLVRVPMYDSAYTLEDESVPFMQLVLHGYLHYSGEAINLSGGYEDLFLRSIEYGSNPFFTVAADHTDLLKKTAYCYYYSVDWESLKEEITACAAQWADAYKGLENQAMTAHEKLSEDVYRTEYENGTVFYVNYGDTDVQLSDGTQLAARSYLKLGN